MGSIIQGVISSLNNSAVQDKMDAVDTTRGLLEQPETRPAVQKTYEAGSGEKERTAGAMINHSGVICRILPSKELVKVEPSASKKEEAQSLSVQVCEEQGCLCVFCERGHQGKDVGKVLCFCDKTKQEHKVLSHHLCASLATRGASLEREICMEDLDDAFSSASRRRCDKCGNTGAFIGCVYQGCCRWYHLSCSMKSTDVVIDLADCQLYCPKHTVPDSDDSDDEIVKARNKRKRRRNFNCSSYGDDEFAPGLAAREKSQKVATQGKSKSAKSLGKFKSDASQRPRTDWQRRGHSTWVKVVPPWWCEQKTIHFANKVFKELFASSSTATLIDDEGGNWDCQVASETRNDMRLQYTLKGRFQELWDYLTITPGDVLSFEKLPEPLNSIKITKHSNGEGFEDLLLVKSKKRAVTNTTSGKSSSLGTTRAKFVAESPWCFENDCTARKVLHSTNIGKMRFEIPEKLFCLISERAASDSSFAVYDTKLQKYFVFEIESSTSDTKRCVWGKGLMSWLIETAFKPEESIRFEFLDKSIQVSKLSAAGWEAGPGPQAIAASSSTSMDTLAAAACFAHVHGTPGLKAILFDSVSEQREEKPQPTKRDDLKHVLEGRPIMPGVVPKCIVQTLPNDNQRQRSLMDPKLALASFAATMNAISRHQWTQDENALIQRFQTKFAALDFIGREITSFSILQFQDNKPVLLEILKSFVGSIARE